MSALKFGVRLCAGTVLVWYLLSKHEVDLRLVVGRMSQMPLLFLLAALIVNLLGQALCAYRWGLLSASAGYPAEFSKVFPIYFSGMFFNMCLPTSIGGDVIRVVGLSRRTGSKSAAAASVFMDRNIGLAALLLVGLTASLVVVSTIEATLNSQHYLLPIWPIFLLMIAGYIAANVVLFSVTFSRLVVHCLERFHAGFVARKVQKLSASLQLYRQPATRYLWTFFISVLYQASEVAVVWLLALGLGIDVSPWVFFAMVPFQAVACLLPITVNGMGVREGIFCAVLMGQLGNSIPVKNSALALSLVYFFGVVLVSSLIGGVVYLASGMPKPTLAETNAVAEPVASGQ